MQDAQDATPDSDLLDLLARMPSLPTTKRVSSGTAPRAASKYSVSTRLTLDGTHDQIKRFFADAYRPDS